MLFQRLDRRKCSCIKILTSRHRNTISPTCCDLAPSRTADTEAICPRRKKQKKKNSRAQFSSDYKQFHKRNWICFSISTSRECRRRLSMAFGSDLLTRGDDDTHVHLPLAHTSFNTWRASSTPFFAAWDIR